MAIIREKLVKDWYAAWNSGNLEKVSEFYTDDCIYENAATGEVRHGKKEMAASLQNLIADYPDFKLEFKSTFYSENAVCGEYIMSATFVHSSNPDIPANGKKFAVRGAYISEFQNEKAKRHTIYQDYLTTMRQLGLMPTPPAKK